MPRPRQRPVFKVIPVAAPAAGAEIDIVSTAAAGWLVRSIRFRLVTGVAVAVRTVALTLDNQTDEYLRTPAGATQAASLTDIYTGYSGSAGAISSAPDIVIGLPVDGLWMPQGHHLRTVTNNIDAGDQYSQIVMSVIEYPTGPNPPMWPVVESYTEEGDY